MFDVITGPFRVLEEAFLADFKSTHQDPFDRMLIVSPSARLLTHLQTRLATAHPAILNSSFLTFYALASRLLADAGQTERIVTEPAVYHEMIRHILAGPDPEPVDVAIRESLGRGDKAIPKGLAGALAATMKDLRDSGMRADEAIQAAREGFLGVEAPEAASTLALYGRLIGLFEKSRLRSSADLLRRAAQAAPEHPWLKSQKAIFLYGFYDLTGVQLDLVLSLANHANARVYFPYEKSNPAYAYAEKLLSDPAFTSKRNVTEYRSNGVSVSTPTPRHPHTPTREIWSCSGARDEVWQAAKTILKLADEGMPLRDIAVIARNAAAYTAPLREIFDAHAIPYTLSRREPASTHPLVKTIHALLLFDATHSQAKTLREDLEKSVYYKKSSFPTVSGGESMDPLPVTAGDDGHWAVHLSWAKNLILKSIHLPKDASDDERALFSQVLSALDELRILDAIDHPVSHANFLEALFEKFETLERPGDGKNHDGVQVLEVQQARGLSFPALILLGMNEKVFPRLIREDPFLSDAARSALAQATGSRLGRKLDGYEEERFLFELMKESADRYLYLSTQRSDEEGKALIPSVYLKDIERHTPGLKPQRVPRSVADKFTTLSPMEWTPKELSFLMNRARLDPKALYKALRWDHTGFQKLLSNHLAIEAFAPGLGAYDGVLEDLALVAPTLAKPFSPTSLETLAECPFQYYAGHVLKIPVEEELAPEGEITPQALGKLFHKTLELFYTLCRDQGLPVGDTALHQQLTRALNECLAFFADSLSTVYPLALKSSKQLIQKELLSFIKSDIEEMSASGYKPRWFEHAMEGPLPTEGLPYRFYGRPDRLDVKEETGTTEIRVVDYKSGKPKPWTGRIETHLIQGKFLQLPIYMGLAKAVSATLRPVRETDLEATEKTLTADFWKSPSAPIFTENIKELITLIEKAKFYIEPSTGEWGYCTRCDFALVCRKEHMPTRIRAERDPLRQRVVEKMSRVAPK